MDDMRQKRIRQATREAMAAAGVIIGPTPLVLTKKTVSLEIGSGKGRFITDLAKDDPDALFLAMEININVCYRIMQKKQEMGLDNLLIILGDAKELDQYLPPASVDRLYLNFSDPWPKARHHKRRLTAPAFLDLYDKVMKKHGIIQFRTDHEGFFEDTLMTVHGRYAITDIRYDLPPGPYMTEYEEKKRADGPIYQLTLEVK